MPRALCIFRMFGIEPIPAPTDYLIKFEPGMLNNWWLPSIENLNIMNIVIHEYLGLWWVQFKHEQFKNQ